MAKKLWPLGTILGLLLAAGCARVGVTLVEDGRAQAAIYVAPDVMAHDSKEQLRNPALEAELQRRRLRESVNDLAAYLGRMSGAKVEVVTGSPQPGDRRVPILIGSLAANRFGCVRTTYPYKQAFRVVVSPRGVGLFGESDLATSYAIYELLHRLGCRWFMPSGMGECIPALRTIELPQTDVASAPGTIYRGIWYADDAYRRRNRMGGLLLSAGHALELAYLTKDDLAAHPEWQATDAAGKPIPGRYKWSNRELANAIADKILAHHAANPQPSFSLSPDDGCTFDDSPADKALDAGDFDPTCQMTALTDRLLVVANRIAERVTAKVPDVLFGLLAYVQYTRPPLRETPHPAIVPQIAPITYSRAHPMNDDRVPGNPSLRAIVEGWGRKAKATSYYFYAYFLAEVTAPQPMLTKWGHDVPYVLAKGNCRFWQPETLPNFETMMYALYMGNRLAWDPTEKPQDVYREINERFYGAAAGPMAAYWSFVDSVWVDTPEYSGCGFGYLRRWTPERMKRARELMNAAIAAAKTDTERFRIGIADESLKLFELFMKLRNDQAEGRFATLAADADAWRKQVLALGEKYRDQFAFCRVGWTPHTVGGGYFAQFYEQTYKDASRIARDFAILTPKPLRGFRYFADPDKKGESMGCAKPDFDEGGWKTTDVCLETWSSLGLHDYFKSVWYRTSVELPPVPAGKKVFLWVGSTDGSVKVFVNGQHIPYIAAVAQPDKTTKQETRVAAEGYCQPFSFDITAALRPGAKNTLALFCTRTFFNELGTGGLLAPVVLYREKD
ncbi:MAG: DUF4838 domain-containing protein [Planctomycetes bacterium]|nr:DUF4838 domain-containing protein [Planctomycetota bacterium]